MKIREIKLIEKKRYWFVFSFLLIFAGFFMMGARMMASKPILNFGIDFSGGSTLVFKFDALTQELGQSQDSASQKKISSEFIKRVRQVLAPFGLGDSEIQISDSGDLIIKTLQLDSTRHQQVKEALESKLGHLEVLEVDFIGPTVGSELKSRSIWIVLLVAAGLMLYISWRFEFAFGLATLAATLHDALVVLSFASLFGMEINVEFVAALLTIIGYSMNDTVVIFDRIRENLPLLKQGYSPVSVANMSLLQTFSRTIFTVLTTLVMTAALLVFGGATIRDFALVLFVGIVVGTYSSIFIAAPVFVSLFKPKVVKG